MIEEMSNDFIAKCYADYRANVPCEKGMLVDVHDEDDGRLIAIGRCMNIRWCEKSWDYLVTVEISNGEDVWLDVVNGVFISRHCGFCGRSI